MKKALRVADYLGHILEAMKTESPREPRVAPSQRGRSI